MEKCSFSMGQEIHKMRLKYLVVPESKKVLKKTTHIDGALSKVHREANERAPNGQRVSE